MLLLSYVSSAHLHPRERPTRCTACIILRGAEFINTERQGAEGVCEAGEMLRTLSRRNPRLVGRQLLSWRGGASSADENTASIFRDSKANKHGLAFALDGTMRSGAHDMKTFGAGTGLFGSCARHPRLLMAFGQHNGAGTLRAMVSLDALAVFFASHAKFYKAMEDHLDTAAASGRGAPPKKGIPRACARQARVSGVLQCGASSRRTCGGRRRWRRTWSSSCTWVRPPSRAPQCQPRAAALSPTSLLRRLGQPAAASSCAKAALP